MQNKKGQFFLIVTGIIAVVIVGLAASVNNAIIQPQPTVFYDLSKNFDKERMKVVDYGIFNAPPEEPKQRIQDFIENFTKYAREKDPNIDLIYLFGNQESITVVNFAKNDTTVCPRNTACDLLPSPEKESMNTIGSSELGISTDVFQKVANFISTSHTYSTDKVTVKIGSLDYNFDIPLNNQFYFVLKTEKGDEVHIVTNE